MSQEDKKLWNKVNSAVEKAMSGGELSMEEIRLLYGLKADSREAYLLRWAGHKTAMETSKGIAEIHAQIGLDAGPCIRSCGFCSFAKCNNEEGSLKVTPMQAVLDYAKAFQDSGAHLLLLMASAAIAGSVMSTGEPSAPMNWELDDMPTSMPVALLSRLSASVVIVTFFASHPSIRKLWGVPPSEKPPPTKPPT